VLKFIGKAGDDMIMKTMATGASGMRANQLKLDVVGNNIANINTTSFKKSRPNFAEVMRQAMGDEGVPTTSEPKTEVGSGVRMVSISRINEQGDLMQTGRQLDFAIEGEGFFKVVSPDGEKEYYTRDGSFYINNEGILVNANGYRLEPEIKLDKQYRSVILDEKGQLKGEPYSNSTDGNSGDTKKVYEDIGSPIELYNFPSPGNLLDEGNNLFSETEASGEATSGEPGKDGFGVIRQGYLERSNVDLAQEMVGMIEAQRAYASNTRTVQTADEMWDRANNMRK